jgi:hypothetical protein
MEMPMKVHLEIDATPEELRRFFGLPDVGALQKELIEEIRRNMKAGVEGYDPFRLMAPLLPEHMRSMEAFQKAFWNASTGKTGSGE